MYANTSLIRVFFNDNFASIRVRNSIVICVIHIAMPTTNLPPYVQSKERKKKSRIQATLGPLVLVLYTAKTVTTVKKGPIR